mmetsp:Transcript_68254/g.154417  ORF Transcript_68254/g.154417 Transcript_68254/m.154417 type:complete len:1061 (+) Transcript_68254:1654-4836(+)
MLSCPRSSKEGSLLSRMGLPGVCFIDGEVESRSKEVFASRFFEVLAEGLGPADSYSKATAAVKTHGNPEDVAKFTILVEPERFVELDRRLETFEKRALLAYTENAAQDAHRPTIKKEMREYQLEIFEKACDFNVICCLPTGTGKTIIAFRLMEQMAEAEGDLGRPSVFITQNVALMFQQAKACEEETNLRVGKYCGGENQVGGGSLAKENDLEARWFQEISGRDACFFTGGLFKSLCDKGIFSFLDFAMVVIDEAHHTKKDHVFNKLMKDQYFTLPTEMRPKICSLTASLCEPGDSIEETAKSLLNKAVALDSKIAVPTSEKARASLEETLQVPSIEFREIEAHDVFERWSMVYRAYVLDVCNLLSKFGLPERAKLLFDGCAGLPDNDLLLFRVNAALSLDEIDDPLVFILRHLQDVLERNDVILNSASSVSKEIMAMSEALQDVREKWSSEPAPIRKAERCSSISRNFLDLIDSSELYTKIRDGKFQELENVKAPRTDALLKIMDSLVLTLDPDDAVMVFTSTRASAKSLTEVINLYFKQAAGTARGDDGAGSSDRQRRFVPKADYIIGHGDHRSSVKGMTSDEQIEKSSAFKSGKFNILVSTSVCKEGIDVGKCKVGVEHGRIISTTVLTQFMGRVRAKDGTIYVVGDREDKKKLGELVEGRKLYAEAVAEALYVQEIEPVVGQSADSSSPSVFQRRFIEDDAVHVLKEWFAARGSVAAELRELEREKGAAVKANHYSRAAEIKKQIGSLRSGGGLRASKEMHIEVLEEGKTAALTTEDFERVDELHHRIEALQGEDDAVYACTVERAVSTHPAQGAFAGRIQFPAGHGMPDEILGEPRSRKANAERAAAYEACMELGKRGLLPPGTTGPAFLRIDTERTCALEKRLSAKGFRGGGVTAAAEDGPDMGSIPAGDFASVSSRAPPSTDLYGYSETLDASSLSSAASSGSPAKSSEYVSEVAFRPLASPLSESSRAPSESPTVIPNGDNYVGMLNEREAKAKRRPPKFTELGRDGPSHLLVFQFRCETEQGESAEGSGKTVKAAKQESAHKLLSGLETMN